MNKTIVLVVLDDKLALLILEEGSIRKDQLTPLELRVWWQHVLHQPLEFSLLDHAHVLLYVLVHGVDSLVEDT